MSAPVSFPAAVRRSFATALAFGLTVACAATDFHAPGTNHGNDDAVILTFSTVGDSRQDPVKPDPTSLPLSGQDALWLQNTKAITRILQSVQAQGSSFLFFNGDMIMGYGKASVPANTTTVDAIISSDLVQFYRQYAFWRGLVAPFMETGTYIVPVPGNHEVQSKALGKKAQVENERAWRANMGDLILDNARFTDLFGSTATYQAVGDNRAAADGLTTDQSKLSYSFDFQDSHFVIINTDAVGRDSHAPVAWLASDLAQAKARGARHNFVFGHKPAFTYYYGQNLPSSPSGLDIDLPSRDAFWNLIEAYDATYFCGHEHIFNMSQPRAASGGKAWQVLVGSGGSPFEAAPTDVTINPATDRAYAWATVSVLKSGLVRINAYGFDDQFGATRTLQSVKVR
ncbi:MAG: metallophosphoesterase [Opitutus sp.]